MDFMVRRIIKMSITFRNLAFSQAQHVHISRYCNTSYFYNNKVIQSDLKNSKEDLMLKTLQQGLSPTKLLNYIDMNKHQIKREHVIPALCSLHHFYQNKSQSIVNLHEPIDFTKLYTRLKPQIKQLTPTEIIEVLNMLQLLHVPSSNIFVMSLLQHVEKIIEELSLQDVYNLSILLTKFKPTNLNNSIQSSMNNQFLTRIPYLDKNDIITIIYALCFALKNIEDATVINFLRDIVKNYEIQIDLKDALNILILLCNMQNLPNEFTNTIKQVQKIIIDNIDEINYDQILHIIKSISSKISANYEEFYDELFIDEIVQKVIYENWDFLQGCAILSYLNSIQHVQIDLLDYLSAKCYENPNLLNLELDLLQPLIIGLALADYKPVFWDVMKEPIVNYEITNIDQLKLCYFVLHLACLECFEPMLLQEVFSTENIISEEHQQILLRLYQIVKILYPQYNGPWPSKEFLHSFKNLRKNKNQNYPLLSALEQAVGGDAYIKTNVSTTLEHFIDHVVIINRSGYPVAINSYGCTEDKCHNSVTYLEDLTIPPGSQIFLILYAQPEWYARNTQRMLGPYSLFVKTLESSYTVIPVNARMWQKMPQNEKALYIMQAIKLKFEDDSISTTS